MVSFNRVVLAGNLTRDPELRFTGNGIPVCGFGIAVNRVRSKSEEVDFFDITASKRSKVDVVADNVQFLGGRGEGGEGGGAPGGGSGGQSSRSGSRSQDDPGLNEEDFDDIPF